MRLELLAKDSGSGDAGCPSVHLDHTDGMLVVQGEHVDNSELPHHLPGEGGVKISSEIVRDAIRAYADKGVA
ncbi:MAG: hypothetical protein ACRDRL_26110 [Sciscionella sp.]